MAIFSDNYSFPQSTVVFLVYKYRIVMPSFCGESNRVTELSYRPQVETFIQTAGSVCCMFSFLKQKQSTIK